MDRQKQKKSETMIRRRHYTQRVHAGRLFRMLSNGKNASKQCPASPKFQIASGFGKYHESQIDVCKTCMEFIAGPVKRHQTLQHLCAELWPSRNVEHFCPCQLYGYFAICMSWEALFDHGYITKHRQWRKNYGKP